MSRFESSFARNANFLRGIGRRPRTGETGNPKAHQKLVLTPKQTADGTVFDVTGDVELLQDKGGVMLNSSMEGTAQHYISTPIALRTWCSTQALPITA